MDNSYSSKDQINANDINSSSTQWNDKLCELWFNSLRKAVIFKPASLGSIPVVMPHESNPGLSPSTSERTLLRQTSLLSTILLAFFLYHRLFIDLPLWRYGVWIACCLISVPVETSAISENCKARVHSTCFRV